MSNNLRKETDCLNCGAEVTQRFCPNCGQENIVQPEKIWVLGEHYFEDFTHFEGNFFRSIWLLIIRPGYLTNAYNSGQRKRYINPIRMYIFMSLITFTVLFFQLDLSEFDGKSSIGIHSEKPKATVIHTQNGDAKTVIQVDSSKTNTGFSFTEKDTAIQKDDGYFAKKARTALKHVIDYANANPNKFLKTFLEKYIHTLPKSLFVCMPLFTLLIALFYYRRKKYFSEHAIFTLHYHVMILFWIFILLLINTFMDATILFALFFIYMIIYQYKALKNVYHGRRWVNIFKSLTIFTLYYFIIILVQFIFLVYSLATISQES
ncbi:MAG TPA: DUF3667 domain-containing protein [Saprospiraceae bacterium]|nr:DUF3667 domain-containing protein [Saprospiraceae bacterium]